MKKDKTSIALQNPDAYKVGFEDGLMHVIDLLKDELDNWYEFYLRKAQQNKNVSIQAMAQMETIQEIRKFVKAMEE